MGADQVVPANLVGPITPSIQSPYTNVPVGFTVPFTAAIEGRLTANTWNFGDGTILSNQPCTSHSWTAPGLYAVRFTGFNGSHPEGVSAVFEIQAVEQPVYYVNQANPTPVFPHQTWETAARTIQEAVNASTLPARLVLVSNGVYATGGTAVVGMMTNRVVLDDAVILRSVNGPQVTVIAGAASRGGGNGDGAIRCVYLGTNAVLTGCTLTNGHTRTSGDYYTEQSGGAVWCDLGGVVTNCVLTGNSAAREGGGAYGDNWDAQLTLCNCIVYHNTAPSGPNYHPDYHSDIAYSCTSPLPQGEGNIDAAPLLLNAPTGDYRLAYGSPCIDAGSNLSAPITADLDGNLRPLDGNWDGLTLIK